MANNNNFSRIIMVVSDSMKVARVSFNPKANTVAKIEFDGAVAADVRGASRINALSMIVYTLKQVEGKNFGRLVIYCPNQLQRLIHFNSYKGWLLDGTLKDGTPLNETELELWKEFHELMKTMSNNVAIYGISYASYVSEENPTEAQKKRAELAAMAWDMLPKKVDELGVAGL